MKKFYTLTILLSFLLLNSETGTGIERTKQITEIQIDNIYLPEVKHTETKNGMRVLFIKDEIPRFIMTLSVGFGKLYENSGNAGISDLLSKTLSLGGSKKYPAEVLHNTLDNIGGNFSVSPSFEETVIVIQVLQKYCDLAIDILSDIAVNPNLDATIIEKARSTVPGQMALQRMPCLM